VVRATYPIQAIPLVSQVDRKIFDICHGLEPFRDWLYVDRPNDADAALLKSLDEMTANEPTSTANNRTWRESFAL
jgi:hypothetical protein